MFNVDDKENDVKSQEERASKLLGEPVQQKVRRSVLKEFDPIALDSPLPPKLRQPLVEEEEVFEDAETSLSSYLCPINKNAIELTPSKGSYSRESLLIPELKDYRPGQLVNLNDTCELSYSECVEDLSQVGSNQANVTSSDDFEFNYKPKTRAGGSVDQKVSLMDITLDANIENDGQIDSKSCVSEDSELLNKIKNTHNKEYQHSGEMSAEISSVGTLCSDEQPILILEQKIDAEHGETSFKQLGIEQEKFIAEENPSSNSISPHKESQPNKQQSQAVGGDKMEETVNDEQMNQTFEPYGDDDSEEKELEQPTEDEIDVNEIIFVDTQADRTYGDSILVANDPLDGLDPLNVENIDDIDHNSGDSPLEENENVLNLSQNETIEDCLPAHLSVVETDTFSASGSFDDHKADNADSRMIQAAEEKQTVNSARLEDQEETNLGGVKCNPREYRNGNSKEFETLAKTSESLCKVDDNTDKSVANECKPSTGEDITLKLPENIALETGCDEVNETFDANNEKSGEQVNSEEIAKCHEKDGQNRSGELFEVSVACATAEATSLNVEKIDLKLLSCESVKSEDDTIEAVANENIEPENLPMNEAVEYRSTYSTHKDDLLVETGDVMHGPNEEVTSESYTAEGSFEKALKGHNMAEIENSIGGDNDLNEPLNASYVMSSSSDSEPLPERADAEEFNKAKHEQENHQSDLPKPDVNTAKEESPEKEELTLAQLNKTFGSNGEQSVSESFKIENQNFVSSEKLIESSDVINKTFEMPDEDASISKSDQKDTEPNVLEDIALVPSKKTESPSELNNTLETPLVTNVHQIRTEDDDQEPDSHQSIINTRKEESPGKEEPASAQLNETFDSNAQESVPESRPNGYETFIEVLEDLPDNHQNTSQLSCETRNSDKHVLNDAEFAKVEDETANHSFVLPKPKVLEKDEAPNQMNESFETNTEEVDQKYEQDKSLNQPLSSAHLNKTFEATTELNQSNNDGESLKLLSDPSSTSSSVIKAVETIMGNATPQSIPLSENLEQDKATPEQLPETGQSESERAVEALARSLNQTIDLEEPAMVDDIDSTDTSSDNLNATVENVSNNKGCDQTEENQCTENVNAVVNQSLKLGSVEQEGNDKHHSNGAEEKITKDMMKTEKAEKNVTEAESLNQKSVDKNTNPPNRRIECRPNIRSLRNKTQVITNPLLLKPEQISNVTTTAQASDENEKLNDYKRRNDQLRNDVNRLQDELEKLQQDNTKKDQCILSYALGREADRDNLVKYRKVIKAYEEHIIRQKEELILLKAENEKLARRFTSTEMAFSELFEKYEKAKHVVEAYRKNEAILIENITHAENQLAQLDAKCRAMQDQCDRDLERARKQIDQEEESYKQNIAKLQAMVKRLEIKASSLETSLKQKTEECQALAALCDDITGNQPS